MATTEPEPPARATEGPEARRSPPRRSWGLGALLGFAVVLLIAFPIGARVAADDQPVRSPPAVVLPALPAGAQGPAVRDVPVVATAAGAPGRLVTLGRAGLGQAAIGLLGSVHGRELAALMRSRVQSVGMGEDVIGSLARSGVAGRARPRDRDR